ncbi:lipoprotein [Enterococcus hirae]|uniref:BspA family leucine-rich repeat surface protein n=1 Tax=Enterococcus hirae TaxID=1354 RepID=UPI000F6CE8CE|nr:lipoprotein [Enterococcus hirae]
MSKKKLTAKRKKQLLTMFAVAGVMGNTGIAPTMALADTLTPTAETSTEQTQANEAKEVIDQTIQNVTDPLVNTTDSTTTTSDSLAPTDEATDETTDDTQEQATAPTAESEGNATNPTAEAPKVAQKANVAAASKITETWGTSSYTFDENTGVLTIGAGELSGYKESPWKSDKVDPKAIKKIVLSGKVVAPENSRFLFSTSSPGKDLTNVTEIEGLSQLDTSKVTAMNYMFYGMSSLTSLDLSSLDTSKVTSMNNMLYNTPLKKLILGDTFKFINGTEGLISGWKREDGKGKVYTADDFMKNYGTGDLTAGTYVSVETGTWGTSPYTFDENTGVLTIGTGELSGYKESPWYANEKVDAKAIKKIVLSGKIVAPENARLLFSGNGDLKNVTEIEGLSQLDTSNVTAMDFMFSGMSSVTSLDVSGFDTSNVTDMHSMFSGMSSVTSLDVSGFDTSNVTKMYYMFSGMSNLTSLDVSNFNTSNVKDMDFMFKGMSSVTSLDLSGFDTSNVTTMKDMFADTPLKKLILGDTFKFVNGQGALTSAWKREDGKGKAYTAEDFMKNYGTGDLTASTYVSATGWWGYQSV